MMVYMVKFHRFYTVALNNGNLLGLYSNVLSPCYYLLCIRGGQSQGSTDICQEEDGLHSLRINPKHSAHIYVLNADYKESSE